MIYLSLLIETAAAARRIHHAIDPQPAHVWFNGLIDFDGDMGTEEIVGDDGLKIVSSKICMIFVL